MISRGWKNPTLDSARLYDVYGEKKYIDVQERIIALTKIERLFYSGGSFDFDTQQTKLKVEREIAGVLTDAPDYAELILEAVLGLNDIEIFSRQWKAIDLPYWREHAEEYSALKKLNAG